MNLSRWKRAAMWALVSGFVLGPGMSLAGAMESPVAPDPTEPPAAEPTWQLWGQTRRGSGRQASGPMSLRESVRLLSEVACNRKEDILKGRLTVARITLVLDRREGESDEATARTPSGSCGRSLAATSAFYTSAKLRYPRRPGKYVATAEMAVPRAFRLLADLAERKGQMVIDSGTNARITLTLRRRAKPVPEMIVSLARRHGLDPNTALRVAWCESGFVPWSFSPAGYAGVFQQSIYFWPSRARHYGHPGASPFDAYPNVDVSLKMARDQGWGPWGCY